MQLLQIRKSDTLKLSFVEKYCTRCLLFVFRCSSSNPKEGLDICTLTFLLVAFPIFHYKLTFWLQDTNDSVSRYHATSTALPFNDSLLVDQEKRTKSGKPNILLRARNNLKLKHTITNNNIPTAKKVIHIPLDAVIITGIARTKVFVHI